MLKKGQWPIVLTNVLGILYFTWTFVARKNYEFLLYIGVIIFFLLLLLFTNKRVNYPNYVLWGLTLWAFMHMGGGSLFFGGTKLYEIMILPLIGEPYQILKYDQLVHIIGFGVATLVMHHLLKPYLRKDARRGVGLAIVVVMAGLGVGALNEIVEFIATVIVPETGVGGYVNTSLDLVADLIGAVLALLFIKFKEK